MKILRITSLGYEAGGAETGIVLVDAALRRQGHEVRVFTTDAGRPQHDFSDFRCRALSSYPRLVQLLYRLWYPHAYFALRRALRTWKPDIVHVHTLPELSPSVLFAVRRYPTVMTVHGAEDFTRHLRLWTFPPDHFVDESFSRASLTPAGTLHYWYHCYLSRWIYRWGIRNVDQAAALSRFMQKELKKDGIDAAHIPNFTLPYKFAPLDINSRTILFAGRLEKIKGVGDLIDAMHPIRKAHPDATLIIAGDGNYRAELQQRARPLGAAVRFVGHKTRQELGELYAQSAIVVVPSVWPEPFGKIGIEAMSVGRPVVATDVGGISEWMNEAVGRFVPPGDANAIGSAIDNLFRDDALRASMANAGRPHALVFSVDRHLDHTMALYRRVLASANVRRPIQASPSQRSAV